ncbi:phospholipid-binding lipoprotein MlaA [Oryzomicrobium terrae]|uniref:Phospholipid-binding lipoprotein MlaA n=1 Tax=Oryzomicrobium terrae TaxID=1735038 RepID=A0A5C1EAL3_9RHOO|nr:VacJ family lipoprotein [Oryzomicrobium terrae]QEL65923.1 phospholipid-binding lipoprotein MlaA [Oryzomicrobium terrae]
MKSICKLVATGLLAGLVLSGCATTGENPRDPWESQNRAVFAFNEGVDKYALKPVAQGYDYVLPTPVKTGVTNFFDNIADLMIGVNNLIQGKPADAASDLGRLLINSTVGILGVFDVATPIGLEKHEEDFGQSLGRWGLETGPYVVLPIAGPRDVRDTGGFVVDLLTDPLAYYPHQVAVRNSLWGTRLVNTRAQLLPAEKVIEEAALDKYSYLRDAYLQRRRNLVYDGNPPRPKDDD